MSQVRPCCRARRAFLHRRLDPAVLRLVHQHTRNLQQEDMEINANGDYKNDDVNTCKKLISTMCLDR